MFIKKFYLVAFMVLIVGLSAGTIWASIEILIINRKLNDINTVIGHQYRLPSKNWSYEKPVEK